MPCVNIKPKIPTLPDLPAGISFDVPLPTPQFSWPPLMCCKPPELPTLPKSIPLPIPPASLAVVNAALRKAQSAMQAWVDVNLTYQMECPRK